METTSVFTDQHHPTLYYEDGNVVLSAFDGTLSSRRYFRVHRSILCRYSPVLADMFSLPPLRKEGPGHAIAEMYDGALHIQMPDSAADIESMLNVLYDPLYVSL